MSIRLIYITDIRFPMERANAIQTINTCHSIAQKGIEVHLLVRKVDNKTDIECFNYYGLKTLSDLKLSRLRVSNGKSAFILKISFLIRSLFRILRLSLTKKKLIYYTRDLKYAYIYYFIGKIFKASVVFESHTVNHRHFAEIHMLYDSQKSVSKKSLKRKVKIERKVFQRMNGIVVITEHLKKQIKKDFAPTCKIKVIRDAATPLEVPDKDKKLEGIFYIGQLYPWKGVDSLIKAMCSVNNQEKLYIVGGLEYENDLENLKRLAALLKIDKRVKFVGNVPHKQVEEYIRKAKICVIPLPFSQIAAFYTSPMKMFEYLAAGKAIVASDLPSLAEVLKNGHNALLFKPGQPKEMASAINKLLKNPVLRYKLSLNAWKDSHNYSWEKRADAIISFIKKV